MERLIKVKTFVNNGKTSTMCILAIQSKRFDGTKIYYDLPVAFVKCPPVVMTTKIDTKTEFLGAYFNRRLGAPQPKLIIMDYDIIEEYPEPSNGAALPYDTSAQAEAPIAEKPLKQAQPSVDVEDIPF